MSHIKHDTYKAYYICIYISIDIKHCVCIYRKTGYRCLQDHNLSVRTITACFPLEVAASLQSKGVTDVFMPCSITRNPAQLALTDLYFRYIYVK